VIARFLIFLPFDLFVSENDEWPMMELTTADYRIKIHPPLLRAERPDPTGSVLGTIGVKVSACSFSENVLVNGKKIAHVNMLTLDFIKPEFNRTQQPTGPTDPDPEFAYEIANEFLARVRVYSRAFQIKPILTSRDPWRLRYLTDDGQELEVEEGKFRGQFGFTSTLGFATITPEIMQMVGTHWHTAEPYAWDLLLLDAQALLPEVGSAIVIAAAALETFIGWALNVLNENQPLPGGLWTWINDRDHWSKEPSVSEEFDVLLHVFTGHSLKDNEPSLWQQYSELRHARNSLAHEGVAKIGGKPIDASKEKLLIDAADKIIRWVETFIPGGFQRVRTAAVGPFSRRIATPQESEGFGPSRIVDGKLGAVPPGGKIAFGFQAEQGIGQESDNRPPEAPTNSTPPESSKDPIT